MPYQEVLCKNRYVGRTFIQPSMRLRQLGVAKKFGPLTENFKGKKIVIVDDSIVRGNTMNSIVKLLRNAGAKQVSSTGLESWYDLCKYIEPWAKQVTRQWPTWNLLTYDDLPE